MKNIRKIVIFFLFTWLLTDKIFAATETKKLNQIIHKISAIKTDLSKNTKQKTTIEHQLKSTEININKTANKLQQANKKIVNQQIIFKNLDKNQTKVSENLRLQQNYLLTQTQSMYKIYPDGPIKMFLNQEDPSKNERMLIYNQHLLSQRLKLIAQTNQTILVLKKNKIKIQATTQTLVNLKNQQQNEHNKLEQLKANKIKILSQVENKIQSQNERLKVLLANKENLEKLIAKITAAKKAGQKTKKQKIPKMATKQKFIWPTSGKVTVHYGSAIEQSQWKWNGILIAAKEGQPVRAISPGKAVFAEFLAGYGLLLIVEHDNGFMSLYGRNQSLKKKVGDKISAGEVIATVGHTGGDNEPALYFGIRYYGKPINPEIWNKTI